jgi:hypothetical protein
MVVFKNWNKVKLAEWIEWLELQKNYKIILK